MDNRDSQMTLRHTPLQSGTPFESATRNQVVLGSCYKIRVGSFSSTSPFAGKRS